MALDRKGFCTTVATAVVMFTAAIMLLANPAWSQESPKNVGKYTLHAPSDGPSLRDEQQLQMQREEAKERLFQRQGAGNLSRWAAGPQAQGDQQQQPRRNSETRERDPLAGEDVVPKEFDNQDLVTKATISIKDCKMDEGASVIVEDEVGTLGLISDGNGANFTSTEQQITIEGEPKGDTILITTDNDQDLQGEVVVVESSGIKCKGSNPNPNPTPDPDGDTCLTLNPPLEESGTAPFAGFVENTGSQAASLRIVYATSSDDGSLNIVLTDPSGQEAINETIEGAQNGVVEEELEPGTYDFEITPQDQGYAVVIEGGEGTGTDSCTDPESLEAPAAPEAPDDPADDGTDDATDDGTDDTTDTGTEDTGTDDTGTDDAGTDDTGTGADDGADQDCADFPTQGDAQDNLRGDPSDSDRLDGDDDGEACEALPDTPTDNQYEGNTGPGGDSGATPPGGDPDSQVPVEDPIGDVVDEIDTAGEQLPETGGQSAEGLPNTGGLPVIVLLLGMALVSAGAVVRRLGMRQG